jgi:PmbA protein
VPVLFEAPLASGLLGAYVQATSGGSLYRKASFLLDSLGQRVLPKHVDIDEDPHQLRGKGSAPFDDEGVRTSARKIVESPVWSAAISFRAIRRASWGCAPPATPAVRRTWR